MFETISRRTLYWLWIWAGVLLSYEARGEDFEFFETHVRPVLADNCYKCHSSRGEKVKGGLLLDTKEGLLKGGDTGPAIVPGQPEKSLLIKAVRYTDKDLQMPPKDHPLPANQVADLVTWVKMGAPDPRVGSENVAGAATQKSAYDFAAARRQWAFQKPKNTKVPSVKNPRWVKTTIDQFILAKLEAKNLEPAPPCDKRSLIRRATFDLTGLPPTPREVADFLADKSPKAFARVVDRLLASPQYGERWGRHWLDVVRYADSLDSRASGEGDISESYRYRDWVVNAFNQDMPYDQFVREQIAGDLLQPKDPEKIDTNGIIATGLYAIGNWGNGDADKDKILTDIADDQVDVTGRAFLGLTLACARCHDHKFDPIPTADYYSLAGIFFSSHIIPKLTPKGQGENMLFIPLASKAELARREKRERRMAELEKQIAATTDEQVARLVKEMLPHSADYMMAAASCRDRASEGAQLDATDFATNSTGDFQPLPEVLQLWVNYFGFGGPRLLSRVTHDFSGKPGLHALRNASNADTPSCVINATDQVIAFSTITMPARSVAIHPSPKGGVAAAWKSPVSGTIAIKGRVADADPNCGDGIEWKIEVESKGGMAEIASGAIPNGGAQGFGEGKGAEKLGGLKINAGDTVFVVVLPKGDYACDTTVVELEVTNCDDPKRPWNLASDVIARASQDENPYPDSQGHGAVWRFYDMGAEPTMAAPTAGSSMAKWLDAVHRQASKSELTTTAMEVQRALLSPDPTNSSTRKIYADLVAPRGPFWTGAANIEKYFTDDARKTLAAQKDDLSSLKTHSPPPLAKANGLQDGGVPESPHAGVHDVRIHLRGRYDRLSDVAPRRFPRLLAGDDQKPITAGSGRIELANWIASPENPLTARVMVNRIWQHHFGEGIVRTPNNYGKLGTPPTHPELLDYLANRFVESGWSIKAMHRAIMLSATYQQSSIPRPETLTADPDNLLFGRVSRHRVESEALRDSLLSVTGELEAARGGPAVPDLNSLRRTLYVKTVRSDRATYQFLFDAADPAAIVEKRIDSTVAPQALFLLNHPFVLARTKALTQRLMKEAPADNRRRIEWLYQLLYCRPANKQEIKLGLGWLEHARTGTQEKEEDAWEDYCQVLICANEFMYVD